MSQQDLAGPGRRESYPLRAGRFGAGIASRPGPSPLPYRILSASRACRDAVGHRVGQPGGRRSQAGHGGDRSDLVDEILKTKERFGLALRAASAGAWEWNIKTNETLWSDENYVVMGLPVGNGKATYEDWLARVHPEDRGFAVEQVEAAVRGRTDLDFEYRAVWPDGTIRRIRDIGKMMLAPEGEPIGMFGIQIDVTARRVLEDQREHLIRELERRNTQLEEFAHTISHELRTPLVTIAGFLSRGRSNAARGDLRALSGDLDRIDAAQRRMALLLTDLLELCRLRLRAGPDEEIPFADVVREAAASSRSEPEAAGLRIEVVGALPVARGDRSALVEAMAILLRNAVRFTRQETEPRVEIGARCDADGPVVYIRDNGIGIDSAYHRRVFGLFRKLDPREPGTGAGLAIARRIIELHDGRIWVESRGGGHGATFCIHLPSFGPLPADSGLT